MKYSDQRIYYKQLHETITDFYLLSVFKRSSSTFKGNDGEILHDS